MNVSPAVVRENEAQLGDHLSDVYQVVIFNDDYNTMDHVVMALVRVFKHNLDVAVKIMLEAHECGRAIAQVESRDEAQLHKDQLQGLGIQTMIERV